LTLKSLILSRLSYHLHPPSSHTEPLALIGFALIMSTKSTDCLTQNPQCFRESEGTGKSSSGQKNRQKDDRVLIKGVKGLSVQRGQKDRQRDDRDLVKGVKGLSVQRGQKDRQRDDRDLVEGVKGLSVQRGQKDRQRDDRDLVEGVKGLSVQRGQKDRQRDDRDLVEGVKGLSVQHGQKDRQRDDRDLVEGVKGLSVQRVDERPPPHKIVSLSNQLSKNHPPTRSREQTSSLTSAAPRQCPIKRGTKAPRPASNASPLKASAKAPTKPPTKFSKKTTEPDRKDFVPPPVGPPERVLRSETCRGNYTLHILINQMGESINHFSLRLDREYENQIISDLVGEPGHYQYRERVGVDVDPGFVTEYLVDEIEPRRVHEYRHIVGSPELVDRTGFNPTDEWCIIAVRELDEEGLIQVDDPDDLHDVILGLITATESD
jgi:hypothetical protein